MTDSFRERHRFKFYTIGMVICGILVACFLKNKHLTPCQMLI